MFYAFKKPLRVEVVQFLYELDRIEELKNFLGNSMGKLYKARRIDALAELEILTLEDGKNLRVKHIATEGDYIVKGYNGEFWPVKKEIFKATYERF